LSSRDRLPSPYTSLKDSSGKVFTVAPVSSWNGNGIVLTIRIFDSTDLLLDISISNIFIKVRILCCMHWLADMSRCGSFRGYGQTVWRQFGFAGHCKVVLNSTIRARLSSCRRFKLVPDMRFGAELAADFSLSSGG